MTDDQLLRSLRSVGMTAFVTHLAPWDSPQSNADVAERLVSLEGWSRKASLTRVSNARRILASGRRTQALHLIFTANVPEGVRALARRAAT